MVARFALHMRAPTGTRIEETARIADGVEAAIRQMIPAEELETVLDNIGVPKQRHQPFIQQRGHHLGRWTPEILMALREDLRPTQEYINKLRAELPKRFPGVEFFFQPADIVTQILNFGLPAAIDVQFTGNNMANERGGCGPARAVRFARFPGAVDVHRTPATRLSVRRPAR